jgi:hypothetical protein
MVERTVDRAAKAFEKMEGRDADLGFKGVYVTGYE